MKTVTELQDQLRATDLLLLLAEQKDLCVSLYVPVHQPLTDSAQAALRTRQLLRSVETQLLKFLSVSAVETILAPIRVLNDSSTFWRQIQFGAAFLISKDMELVYSLPYPCVESATVGTHFNVRPLLPLLNRPHHFFVLSLSQGEVKLYRGTEVSMDEIAIDNAPSSLAEALRYDEFEKQLQSHSSNIGAPGGRTPTIFHGQGSAGETAVTKKYLLRFLQELEQGVAELLHGESVPLIMAGVEYMRSMYRQVSQYPHLLEVGIEGNSEHLKAHELQSAAMQIVDAERNTQLQSQLHSLDELLGAGDRRALADVDSIVHAAHLGRVDTFFVTPEASAWGAYDAELDLLEKLDEGTPNTEDLVNLAAIFTLQNGGKAIDVASDLMPAAAKIAALLRY